MIDKETIRELTQAAAITQAAEAVNTASDGPGAVALPQHFALHDMERYLQFRRRPRGTMTTSSLEAFGTYVKAHAEDGASVFVDPDAMRATAVLNLGTPDEPGHCDSLAVLHPKQTAAYTALLAVANGRPQPQTAIAEWIEDWHHVIACASAGEGDEGDEETAWTMPPRRAVAAVRNITIEAMQKLENSEGQLSASRSALEQVKANSQGNPLPAFISMSCVPFAGLASRLFVCRLSIVTAGQDKKPALVLRIVKAEEHLEQMAEELVALVDSALGADSKVPSLIGHYRATA